MVPVQPVYLLLVDGDGLRPRQTADTPRLLAVVRAHHHLPLPALNPVDLLLLYTHYYTHFTC